MWLNQSKKRCKLQPISIKNVCMKSNININNWAYDQPIIEEMQDSTNQQKESQHDKKVNNYYSWEWGMLSTNQRK